MNNTNDDEKLETNLKSYSTILMNFNRTINSYNDIINGELEIFHINFLLELEKNATAVVNSKKLSIICNLNDNKYIINFGNLNKNFQFLINAYNYICLIEFQLEETHKKLLLKKSISSDENVREIFIPDEYIIKIGNITDMQFSSEVINLQVREIFSSLIKVMKKKFYLWKLNIFLKKKIFIF